MPNLQTCSECGEGPLRLQNAVERDSNDWSEKYRCLHCDGEGLFIFSDGEERATGVCKA